MPTIEEQIEIAAARADVFRFCHDISSWPDWHEQIVHVELLTSPPLRSGALLRIDQEAGGTIFSWDAEYITFQMPSGSRLKVIDVARSSPFRAGGELSWQFESAGNSTLFIWRWDYQPYGFWANLSDSLGRRAATQRAIKRGLAKLKELVESGRRARLS